MDRQRQQQMDSVSDRQQTNKHPFIKGIGRGGVPFDGGLGPTSIDYPTKLLRFWDLWCDRKLRESAEAVMRVHDEIWRRDSPSMPVRPLLVGFEGIGSRPKTGNSTSFPLSYGGLEEE